MKSRAASNKGRSFERVCRVLLVAAAAVHASACIGPVPKVDTNPAKLAAIRTIAVLRAPEPNRYVVSYPGTTAGVAFGLIGAAFVAADVNRKMEDVTQLMNKQGVKPVSTLIESVRDRLAEYGYAARVEDGPWESSPEGNTTIQFAQIRSDADAVLIIAPNLVGFMASGDNSPYVPTVTAVVTLLGPNRGEPIYRGYHASGYEPRTKGWKWSPVEKWYADYAALTANPQEMADSLNKVGLTVARSIADDLKRK